jgi:hypothetical protein
MTTPVGAPNVGESLWLDQSQTYFFANEPGAKFEMLIYYRTQNGRVTRATIENTTTGHPGRVVVRDGQDVVVSDIAVTAPFPLTEYDLSGLNVTVRANDLSDKFSISVGVLG